MKNSADRRVLSTSALMDNSLLDLQNSSYPMKAEFNKYYLLTESEVITRKSQTEALMY